MMGSINSSNEKVSLLPIGENQPKYPKTKMAMAASVMMLYIFSYMLNSYVINEYAYFAIANEQFPDGMSQDNGNGSSCDTDTNSTAYKQQLVVQSLQSRWSMYCTLAGNLPSIVVNLNIVSYSDVYGRKLFFLFPLFGTMFKSLFCAIGMFYSINLNWFILFSFVEGCGGLWISMLAITFALLSDLTEAGKKRSFAIGVFETGFEMGIFLSSLLSGYLIKVSNGFYTPIIISEVVAIVGILFVLFVVPETLPDSKRRHKISNIQNVIAFSKLFRTKTAGKSTSQLFIMAIAIFSLGTFAGGDSNVNLSYELGAPFCWSTVKIGNFSAAEIVYGCVVCVLMIKVLQRFTTDQVIALVSLVTTTISSIWWGISSSSFMLYLAPVLASGQGLAMPMMRGLMSKLAPSHLQGSLFGCIGAVEAVVNMTGSMSANAVYSTTVGIYRGIVFFVSAGYGLIGCIICLVLIKKMKDIEKDGNGRKNNISST